MKTIPFDIDKAKRGSNIIVVDGHTYTWEWQGKDLVLMSPTQDLVFPWAAADFEIEATAMFNHEMWRSSKYDCTAPSGLDNIIWEDMNNDSLIEDYVNKHKDTATVINNYEG